MNKIEKWGIVKQITHWDYHFKRGAYDQLVRELYAEADKGILEFLHTGKSYHIQYLPIEAGGAIQPNKESHLWEWPGVHDMLYEFHLFVSIQEVGDDWQDNWRNRL